MKPSVNKAISSPGYGKQRGASFLAAMIMLALLGLFILASLKLAPAYVDHNVIMNTLENIKANNNMNDMSIREIRSSLSRTLITNNIRDFDTNAITLIEENNGNTYINIEYESRVELFYNISALVHFEDRIDLQD